MSAHPCPACEGETEPFASATVLESFRADYWRCTGCGTVHVAEPTWLDQAYSTAIAHTDIGLPARARRCRDATVALIRTRYRNAMRVLDYGGGNGLFVRMMRDEGFDCRWYDPYAVNEFARGFESSLDTKFDIVTAFEVLEHVTDPVGLLSTLRGVAPVVISTTLPLPAPTPKPDEWWYYSLATGQHITFFTHEGLRRVAARVGCTVSSGGDMHVFADRALPPALLRMLTAERVARLFTLTRARKSLLQEDYDALGASGR